MRVRGRIGIAFATTIGLAAAVVAEVIRGAYVTSAVLAAFLCVLWLPHLWRRVVDVADAPSGPRLQLWGLALLLYALTIAELAGVGVSRDAGKGMVLLFVSLLVTFGLARTGEEEAFQRAVREVHAQGSDKSPQDADDGASEPPQEGG